MFRDAQRRVASTWSETPETTSRLLEQLHSAVTTFPRASKSHSPHLCSLGKIPENSRGTPGACSRRFPLCLPQPPQSATMIATSQATSNAAPPYPPSVRFTHALTCGEKYSGWAQPGVPSAGNGGASLPAPMSPVSPSTPTLQALRRVCGRFRRNMPSTRGMALPPPFGGDKVLNFEGKLLPPPPPPRPRHRRGETEHGSRRASLLLSP